MMRTKQENTRIWDHLNTEERSTERAGKNTKTGSGKENKNKDITYKIKQEMKQYSKPR